MKEVFQYCNTCKTETSHKFVNSKPLCLEHREEFKKKKK